MQAQNMDQSIKYIKKKGKETIMQILTILVIEDEDSLLQLYRIVLEKEGFKVLTVHNGQEAGSDRERTCRSGDHRYFNACYGRL